MNLSYYFKGILMSVLLLGFVSACGDDNPASTEVNSPDVTVFNITENISSDTTWETGNTYILGGRITVLAGATLTIEPGVVVKGETGSGSNATALLVARGGTLNANGQTNLPIVLTSISDDITPEQLAGGDLASPNLGPNISGLWGGLIVLGNAPISATNESGDVTETQIEGIPTSDSNGLYGGNDPGDSSGSIRYISIRHGGANIGEGNEINGLTLGGVGSGTTIQNVEIVANQDDGIELFGGTVNVTNVLVWNAGDDAIDTDQAFSGTIDNILIVGPKGSAFELDGPEGNFTSTGHTIQNATTYLQGNGSELMIDVDANTDVFMNNLLFTGLDEGGGISSDYIDYANNPNGYAITDIEVILPPGTSIGTFFPTELASEVTSVANLGSATVGANVNAFIWTWARQDNPQGSIGLE
ncbi:right-handed parallel beta-helix repeat-containing protein [Rhodohalobacter mucosus]|uniref:right-handed parallel beta-helix repeat-containing protein n=1 Tax=Rhodohalobacter mucosus TaxID=2079485 RepID=UPI001FA939AC|nr:right-handed parallel beta-helix repeat-containing protein [Rhodohalobacter mucosus]